MMHYLKTYEQQKAMAARMNLMDDPFFQKIAEDKEVCEELLQILLDKPDLTIIESHTQRHLRNLGAHSVILDVLCEDSSGSLFNIEVQKDDKKKLDAKAEEYQKRVRFNLANMDTVFAEKGIPYNHLPDLYAVFISEIDPFKLRCTTYHVRRSLEETDTTVQNGVHEIYVNTAVVDNTVTSQLMQYFINSNGYNANFKKTSQRVIQFKETNEGVKEMTSVFDEYAQECIREYDKEKDRNTAINGLKEGISVDVLTKLVPSLSKDSILELKKQLELQTAI